MDWLKKVAYIICFFLSSFCGIQVGQQINGGSVSSDQVRVLGQICGINLSGVSANKRFTANDFCEKFDRLDEATINKIRDILAEVPDAVR